MIFSKKAIYLTAFALVALICPLLAQTRQTKEEYIDRYIRDPIEADKLRQVFAEA